MTTRSHWEGVYERTEPTKVGWYQSDPEISRKFIESAHVGRDSAIIDVGGGASLLVDRLLDDGFRDLTVLDISAAALEYSRSRLGNRSPLVTWVNDDVTCFTCARRFELWHDRAVFHFLTKRPEREKYMNTLRHTLAPGGHIVMGTFALDGPSKCSGLDVARYSKDSLRETLGPSFELRQSANVTHLTPSGTEQRYIFCLFAHKQSTDSR